ncbi:MAG: NAD(P)-dependent oxidoreductase [Lamprobacter sp.]|uniref:NAD-dependent epimerase/dehydratase family protein n=1 Tax=Lamprobacter sp. TaxID=3100796 RepID=UPI002B2632EF|nr:NAD(P)-dependent oxidoreductase [Lamprobacter sp.]MEA3641494.1 NAD(P)-dependent oxidoreductase [Lamprobacter sp.]
MNIFLSGGDGFIGRNLVERFQEDGYHILYPTAQELDLTKQAEVDDFFFENKIDLIIHSATTLRNGSDYPGDVCELNLKMFYHLAKAKNSETRLINIGSGSEYSRPFWHKKMSETFFGQHMPVDGHSVAKYVISKYIEDRKIDDMVTLRLFGIFGKHEDYRYKFISNAITKNLLGMPIIINQNASYDYIYIDDFYKILKCFIAEIPSHRAYNITPTESVDLLSIAHMINKIGGRQSEIKVLNEGLGASYSGDNSRLLSEWPGIHFMSLSESIENLYAFYADRVDTLDADALIEDKYLDYAKKIRKDYLSRQ